MAIQTQVSGKSLGAEIWDKEGKVVSFYYHQYKTQRMTLHMDLEYLNLVFPIIPYILGSHFAQDFY